jgi:membrane-associated phospholipid phosphatase
MTNLDRKMTSPDSNRYNFKLLNLPNSPEPHEMALSETGLYNRERNGGNTISRLGNVHDGRNGRIEEIHNNNTNTNTSPNMNHANIIENNPNRLYAKNGILVNIAEIISGTVSVMYISLFVMFIINKNIKWFYILILIFIINLCTIILKILLMRFNLEFMYRPNGCEDEHRLMDFLHHNFILETIMKKIDIERYKQFGFPSIHVTTAASILTMIYLFFPKYKQITFKTGTIYMILLGISRIYLNCHNFIQVLGGIFLGVIAGKIAYRVGN